MKTASGQEKMILGLTATFVFIFICIFMGFKNKEKNLSISDINNINYEMAKAKSSEVLYSLEGREIDRENQELNSLSENNKNKKLNSDLSKPEKLKKIETVKNNQNKKSDANLQAALTAKKTAADLKSAHSKNKVVDLTEQKSLETESDFKAQTGSNLIKNISNTNDIPAASNKKYEVKNNIKNKDQWFKEILLSNDRQIVLQFAAAYKNNDITDVDFYSVVSQLLSSADENKKGFGLYALRATPSLASYAALVKAQPSLTSTYQSYTQEALLSYHQPGFLNYLHQALKLNDKQIILKTLDIVKIGLTDVKNGTTTGLVESRYRRDINFMTFAAQNYQNFLPELNQLQNQSHISGDQDIFMAAGQLSQFIQSTTVVAAN